MSDSRPSVESPRPVRFRYRLLTLLVLVSALSILFAVPYGASFVGGIVKWVATVVLLFGALIGAQYLVYVVLRRVIVTSQNPRSADAGSGNRAR